MTNLDTQPGITLFQAKRESKIIERKLIPLIVA